MGVPWALKAFTTFRVYLATLSTRESFKSERMIHV